MSATTDFYIWFFKGLNGLGGWFLFFLLAVIGMVVVLFDSSKRRLPATGWKTAVILLALLTLPAAIFRFAGVDIQDSLKQFPETIFYLGLLGGVLPPVIAAGYFVTFRGMVGCKEGHVYDANLRECPECARRMAPPPMPVMPQPYIPQQPMQQQAYAPAGGQNFAPPKPKAQAWLVSTDGRNYQLNVGETTVGRASTNDIQLGGDNTVSKMHAKLMEQNGHFRLVDLGSTNGTFVNRQMVRQPVLLEPDDEVRFGDNIVLRFITSRR